MQGRLTEQRLSEARILWDTGDLFDLIERKKGPSLKETLNKRRGLLLIIERSFPGISRRIIQESKTSSESTVLEGVDALSLLFEKEVERLKQTLNLLSEENLRVLGRKTPEELLQYLYLLSQKTGSLLVESILDGPGEHYLSLLFQTEQPGFFFGHVRALTASSDEQAKKYYSDLFLIRQSVDGFLSSNERIASFIKAHPSSAPFLRLHYYYTIIKTPDSQLALFSIIKLIEKMEKDGETSFDPHYVPSIGVEVEINDKTPLARNDYEYFLTTVFGIPNSDDEQWEFAIPPSDARMQARFLQELLKGGWINKDELKDNQQTMHLNIGIPEGVMLSQEDAGFLSYALIASYANKTRIIEGAYGDFFIVEGGMSFDTDNNARKIVDGTSYKGRLEVRALSLIEQALYRTIFDSSLLAATCYAAHRESDDPKDVELAKLWHEFQQATRPLFDQINLDTREDSFSVRKSVIADNLLSIQDEVKKHLRILTRKAAQIVSAPEEQVIQEIPQAA